MRLNDLKAKEKKEKRLALEERRKKFEHYYTKPDIKPKNRFKKKWAGKKRKPKEIK